MWKVLLARGVLVVLLAAVGLVSYVAIAGADVTVIAPGCGDLQPPTVLRPAWTAQPDGGVMKLPPQTVRVDAAPRQGDETITVKAALGLQMTFTLNNTVQSIQVDSTTLFMRPTLEQNSVSVDLSRNSKHVVVVLCN